MSRQISSKLFLPKVGRNIRPCSISIHHISFNILCNTHNTRIIIRLINLLVINKLIKPFNNRVWLANKQIR